MKNNKMKGWLAMVLATITLATMVAGCGDDKDPDAADKLLASKQYVYSAQDIEVDIDMESLNNILVKGDRIYARLYEYTSTDTSSTNREVIYSFKIDGSDIKEIELSNQTYYYDNGEGDYEVLPYENTTEAAPTEDTTTEDAATEDALIDDMEILPEETQDENEYVQNFTVDDEGNIYLLKVRYSESYDDLGNYTYMQTYSIDKLDADGNELSSTPLSLGEEMYVIGLYAGQEGSFILASQSSILVYDEQMKLLKTIETNGVTINNLTMLSDGKALANGWNETTYEDSYRILDFATGVFGEPITLPGSSYYYTIYAGGNGYDLYLTDNLGIYGYNMGDEAVTMLMNFVDSDVAISYLNSLVSIGENQFLGIYNDYTNGYSSKVVILTKVNPEDIPDKEIITLAALWLNSDVKSAVIDFNKSSDLYRIRIENYDQYATDEDYNAGITKLNTDIVGGKVPDILLYNQQLPYDSYISKGLFLDINKLIDEDETINREDYLANVFDAFTSDEKLYVMVPRFTVMTVVGKESELSAYPNWTMSDMITYWQSKPDAQLFEWASRENYLYLGMALSGDSYINWETGQCNFTNEEFYSFLEFINMLPEEIDYNSDEDYWQNYESMYRSGKVLLQQMYLYNFVDFNYAEKGTFGEEISTVGFPNPDGNGSVIMPEIGFSVAARSAHKDGAWEFLKYFMGEEFQSNLTYAFPILKSSFEAKAAEAMERPYWNDENGEKEYYDQTYYVGDQEIVIPPMTQEEVDELSTFIYSINKTYTYDTSVTEIILEEANAYFAGQKTVEDVCAIIQSRVQIYVNENR